MKNILKRPNHVSPVWADKLLPFDFTVEHLPGKDMGFVDYLSRHPSGEPVPVSLDDKKFVIASVNHISTLLVFDHLMPRNSWSQMRNNSPNIS